MKDNYCLVLLKIWIWVRVNNNKGILSHYKMKINGSYFSISEKKCLNVYILSQNEFLKKCIIAKPNIYVILENEKFYVYFE